MVDAVISAADLDSGPARRPAQGRRRRRRSAHAEFNVSPGRHRCGLSVFGALRSLSRLIVSALDLLRNKAQLHRRKPLAPRGQPEGRRVSPDPERCSSRVEQTFSRKQRSSSGHHPRIRPDRGPVFGALSTTWGRSTIYFPTWAGRSGRRFPGGDGVGLTDNELVRLVNKIIVEAYQQGASDIPHRTPAGQDKTIVRFRKDAAPWSKLHREVPASLPRPLVTRSRSCAASTSPGKRKPQGRGDQVHEVRPSISSCGSPPFPTAGGGNGDTRILAAGEPIPRFSWGDPENREALVGCVEKPCTAFSSSAAPNGSGKMTTLISVLGQPSTGPATKIWTAEIRWKSLKGRRQVQVNKKAGSTCHRDEGFRAGPDIIMVGEMRPKTTGIGIEASPATSSSPRCTLTRRRSR